MRGKRAQIPVVTEGKFVASLIFVIAIAIILYVLFIPPGDRQQLLNPSNNSQGGFSEGKIELLSVSPGSVSPTKDFGIVHQMPSVNIFVKKEPKVVKLASSLTVKKGLFSKSFPVINFESGDSDLKRVSLVFAADAPSGELRISLNGNPFFAESLNAGSVRVIDVPVHLIRDNNRLSFEVSSPGLAFWRTNQYSLNEITLKEEFERIHSQESRQFSVSADEVKNLETAELSYFQFCNLALADQTTALKVYMNDQSVFSGLVRCISTKQTINVEKRFLAPGVNTVRFLLEQGDFTFNEVKVETKSRQIQNPTYLFSLSRSQYKDIKVGNRTLELQLILDDRSEKRARILVNDGDFFLKTGENTLKQNLKDYVVDGTNFIRIVPSNTFTIVGLKVVLE
ncbi:MAG: hypothetical protein WC595_01930 [Candidatus Nanoarchaeia archaeon]